MVLGIISVCSLPLCCCGCLVIISIPLGIIAVVMGLQAQSGIAASGGVLGGSGKAIAGIVMGSTGIAVGAILLAVNLLLFGFSFTSPLTGLPSPTT